jgi:hypothetical protein
MGPCRQEFTLLREKIVFVVKQFPAAGQIKNIPGLFSRAPVMPDFVQITV